MATNDLSPLDLMKKSNDNIKSLIHDCFSSNLLNNQLFSFKKLKRLDAISSLFSEQDHNQEIAKMLNKAVSTDLSSLYRSDLNLPTRSHAAPADLETLYKSFIASLSKNLETFTMNVPLESFDNIRILALNEVQQHVTKTCLAISHTSLTVELGRKYTRNLEKIVQYIGDATSYSVINYLLIYILNNQATLCMDKEVSSLENTTAEETTIHRQAKYFKNSHDILRKLFSSTSLDIHWREKLKNALISYFVLLIINPRLPCSHPIIRHSFSLAEAFVGLSKAIPGKSLISSSMDSVEILQPLDKINNQDMELFSYINCEFADQIQQMNISYNIGFTREFSASAAVLIAQDRSTELLNLYKTSIGSFGNGMMSTISTLMENSFHYAIKATEQQSGFIDSFLHLARASLRSQIGDWNGVAIDLKLLEKSDVVDNYHYVELQNKFEHAAQIRKSNLNEQQRIEYLLIRSFICTSVGEFEDAFTALLNANNMIKSASSGNSKTKNATNYGDYKLYLEFQSIIETANKYLQEHLSFSILCMHQKFNGLLKLQSLNSYIQNLSILIDTCSITYDEQLHKSTINDYLEVLISVEKYRYFDQLDESALLNVLTGLNKCLNLLKESKGQAFYSYGEGFFSDLVNSAIMCETINEDDKQQHPLFQQHCHILALMKARLSYSSESLLKQIVNSEQYRQQPNDNSVSPINVHILTQDHGPRHEPHVRHPNEIHPVISASPDSASSACYNILSLDGGGIRGIVEAIFLMEIERRTGKCIGELFHCFAGSSTGAILACGLAKRKPLRAKYLLNLYLGPKRFKIFRKRSLWPLSWFLASKYSEKGLEQILEAELTTERLSDCHKHDLIITTEIADQGPALFINDRNPTSSTGLYFYNPQEQNDKFSRRHTCNMFLRDVARCSSAGAPLFPSKKLDINGTSYTFYDGGYRFNQPDFIALQWAQHKQIRNENILLLSLGNSNPAPVPFPTIHDLCGFIYNTAAINEVVSFHNPGDYCVLQLGDRYIRISPNINTTVAMDATDPVTLQLLWQATWDKISEMDNNETDLFNKLCIQLLIRNKFPANLVGAWPPPRSARYYPSRHLRDPDGYNKIDKLFRSDVGFDTRRSQLPVLLNQYYSCHRWPSKNKLHYPSLNTYFCHAPLSLAAAMGHIPSILHYLHDLINNMDRSLTAEEADERSVERSNGQLKWHWNSFHYAAANGEIGAAVVLLYSEPLKTVDLKTELEIGELYTMRKLLEQQTQSPLFSYTPSELADENKYNLMKDELNREHSEIKRQIIDITNPDLN